MGIQLTTSYTTGPTASRPSNPGLGWVHDNTDTGDYEFFNGSTWNAINTDAYTKITPQTIFNVGTGGIGKTTFSIAGFVPAGNAFGFFDFTFSGNSLADNGDNLFHFNPATNNTESVIFGRGPGYAQAGFATQLRIDPVSVDVTFSAGINAGGGLIVRLLGFRKGPLL